MTTDEIRSLRDASPFKPFTIHVAGGQSHRIAHRDFLSVSPSGRILIVYQSNDAFSIIDLLFVNELSVEVAPAAPVEGAA